MNTRRETVTALIAAGVLLAGGGIAAAGIGRNIPGPGASPAAAASRAANGRVVGLFVREGGPFGPGGQQPPVVPLSGTVQFARAGQRTIAVRVGISGAFSVRLVPGNYQVSGRTPDIRGEPGDSESTCALPGKVTVTAGHTWRITVACVVP